MATGDHDWTAGEVVSAANMDDYLMLQSVQQFATAAARDAALSARKREGMITHQADTNTTTIYSGAAWSTIGPVHGALLAWTPAITQSVSVTANIQTATYSRVGRTVFYRIDMNITGAGTASNLITVTLPVNVATTAVHDVVGNGYIYDISATTPYHAVAVVNSGNSIRFLHTSAVAALSYLGSIVFTAGLAVNDVVTFSGSYEAAADA